MSRTILNANSIGTGTRYASDVDDTDYIVLRDVIVASKDDSYGFNLSGNSNDVEVRGTVSGRVPVILGATEAEGSQHLHVTDTGELIGTSVLGIGASLYGSVRVENQGEIRGPYLGLYLTPEATSTTRIVNDGLIQGYDVGILAGGTAGAVTTLINDGTIQGGIRSYTGSFGEDRITNTGRMIGDVTLGGSNDRFDNRGGVVQGTVNGGAGDDRFTPGSSAETFSGGEGTDTLVFASKGGVRVSLTDADGSGNTGWAKGDAYSGFERVVGSDGGNDVLSGDAGDNVLEGRKGADTLRGREGIDVLLGGLGRDTLTGGTGHDFFVFTNHAHGGDRITDFGSTARNNDSVRIDASGFGGGLTAGALEASQFRARGDNQAQDGNDRFIFRTSDETLWFDRNGSAEGGLTLLADLQDGAVLTYADIDLF